MSWKLELIPLSELLSSTIKKLKHPLSDNQDKRECSGCYKKYDYHLMAFIMCESKRGHELAFCVCLNCLKNKNWIHVFENRKDKNLKDWKFSMWRLDRDIPHKEEDRVEIILGEDLNFYVPMFVNPSHREFRWLEAHKNHI